MTHEEMIAVIQAHKDGKIIQSRDYIEDNWIDCDPIWDFNESMYRIKPEPREWWMLLDTDEPLSISCYRSSRYAGIRQNEIGGEIVHVREVIE